MEAALPITQMPETVIAATKHDLITPERALTIAGSMDDMAKRGVLYARVLALDILDDEQAVFAREQALAAMLELTEQHKQKRAGIIEVLASYLQESDFVEVISLILEINHHTFRDKALSVFAPRLDDGWRRQLFRAAMSYSDNQSKWRYPREERIVSVAPYVPVSEQIWIFEHMLQIDPAHHKNLRVKIFFALAPYADATLRQHIYENRHAATTLSYEQRLTPLKVLSGLLQRAEDSEKDRYVTDLIDGILNQDGIDLEYSANYVQKLAHEFAPHLMKMQLDAIVHMLLKLSASRSRCFALAQLLPYVDVGLRRLVIEEGLSMIPQLKGYYDMDANDEVRASALTYFAPYVTDNTRVRYLRITRSLGSRERSHPLRELAIHTDDETEKNTLLDEAWDAAVNLPFAAETSHKMNDQTEIMRLIPHLNAELYDRTIDYALHSPTLAGYSIEWLQNAPDSVKQARHQTTIKIRIALLEALAPYLNAEQLQIVLAQTDIQDM
ncbi:MAG: hypothetical protein ACPG7F_15460 [Aggregatilineales bacterium]